MKQEHDGLAPATEEGTPIDLSTFVLGEVTELTKDFNLLDMRWDILLWGQWYPPDPREG